MISCRRILCVVLIGLHGSVGAGCSSSAGRDKQSEAIEPGSEEAPAHPPFRVDGDLSGLFIQWFDEEGTHSAESRDQVPEERRGRVRIDSLRVAPGDRLDPGQVYVADVRDEPGAESGYSVQVVPRSMYESWVQQAVQAGRPAATVTLYGTSWCPACRGAANYFGELGVPFEQKDVEKDPAAAQALAALRREAGINGNGVPVIDIGGTVVSGFSKPQIEQALKNARLL